MIGVAVPAFFALLSLGAAFECSNHNGNGYGWIIGAVFAGCTYVVMAVVASIAAWHYSALS